MFSFLLQDVKNDLISFPNLINDIVKVLKEDHKQNKLLNSHRSYIKVKLDRRLQKKIFTTVSRPNERFYDLIRRDKNIKHLWYESDGF